MVKKSSVLKSFGGFISISHAARVLGVSPDTLRNWEKQGKLIPSRTQGGARRYKLSELNALKQEIHPASKRKHGLLSISRASKALKISKDTLRNWEKKGLINPDRTEGGARRFSKTEVKKLQKELNIPNSDYALNDIFQFALDDPQNIQTKSLTFPLTAFLAFIFLILILGTTTFAFKQPQVAKLLGISLSNDISPDQSIRENSQPEVLGDSTLAKEGKFLQLNADTNITGSLAVEGEGVFQGNLTASNILYGVKPGTNITITGDKQNPTISATGLAELDTLATVTARGAVTTVPLTLSGGATLGASLNLGQLASDPSSPANGATYYNTGSNKFRCYINGSWSNCDTDSDSGGDITAVSVGNGLSGGGTSGAVTVSLDVTTSSTTTTTTANSGIEVATDGLSLLRGCSDAQLLVWDATDIRWECSTISATGVTADSLDFTEFQDTLDLDAALTLNQTTNTWSQTFTGDTTTGLTYTASSITTGSALSLVGPTSTGVTSGASSGFVKIASDVGSAGTEGSLLYLAPDFSAGSATTGNGIKNVATDTTAFGNTDYGYYGSLALTGNAAKTGYGIYQTITSSSTTGDTLAAADLATSATGALASGTRAVYGLRSQPASTAASTGGTLNLYGSYLNPSSTLSGAGLTDTVANNIYGQYITTTATVASDCTTNCTTNQYGLYVANGTSSTNGTSTKYGLYVESPTGADTNYAAYFAGGNVNIQGLSASSAVYTDASKNLTSTAPTSGAIGYWSRTGTTLSPATANDIVSIANTTTTGADLAITNTGVYTGTGIFNLTANSANTGTLAAITGNGLSSGLALSLSSSSTALTTGSLLSSSYTGTATWTGNLNYLDYTPSSAPSTSPTGDLLRLNLGANATNFTGNILNLVDNSSSVFSVSKTQFTTSLPSSFTSAGDLSVAYDINFTNPTTSFIKSAAPITIQSGKIFNSSDLTLKTFNQGSVVVDSGNTTGTTTTGSFVISASALTTGTAAYITSTATSGKLLDLNATETSGTISNIAYGAAATLAGALTGQAIDTSTNVTATGQSITGISLTLNPSVTNTGSGTYNYKGLAVTGSALSQTTAAGTDNWSGVDVTVPALTDNFAGSTVTGSGLKVTTGNLTGTAGTASLNGLFVDGSSTTLATSGTFSGFKFSPNTAATGTTLYGVNIGAISSPGAGTETAINIANGWDVGIEFINPTGQSSGTTSLIEGSFSSASTLLSSTYRGINLDLQTNVTPLVGTASTLVAYRTNLPAATETGNNDHTFLGYSVSNTGAVTNQGTSQFTWSGFNLTNPGALTQNTAAGTILWSGLNFTIPAITQTTGTITANGIRIATGSITTGGTENGVSIVASGVGAGTLNGINIGAITPGAGTETAINIGNGWDQGIVTGTVTATSGSTSYQANLGTTAGAATATFGGVNIGAISGAGTQSSGVNIGANSATATTNYGINIGAISGAGTTNTGVNIAAVSGSTTNYAIKTAQGSVDLTDNSNTVPSLQLTNNTITTLGAGVNTTGMVNLQSTSLSTGNLLNVQVAANSFTTGKLADISTTSTGLTSGNLLYLDWTPGSTVTGTATGDLFKINIGSNGVNNPLNFLNFVSNSSSLFSVSQQQFTTSLPANFTAAGDLSVAYDLNFTNPTSSFVKSAAPLTVQSGETFNSSDLTLKTFNQGTVVFDTAATTGTSVDLTNGVLSTGTGFNMQFDAITTGTGLKISSSNTSQTTSNLLNVTQTGTTTGYTGNLVTFVGSGTTGAGNVLNVTGVNTSAGNAVNITANSLASGGNGLNVNSSTTGALTNGLVYINASAAHTGNALGLTTATATGIGELITASSVTTGSALSIVGPTSTGVTSGTSSGFVKIASDVGSAGTEGSLLYLAPDFSAGSATTGNGIKNVATDATALANTDYGYYGSLALTGNANKKGTGIYSTVTSSSTTAETFSAGSGGLTAIDAATSVTGIISTGTRDVFGLRSQPAVAAANTGGTVNLYGSYLAPSSTTATTGSTTNVYGEYITTTGTLTTDGTINQYGLYVADGTSSGTGTSIKYGIYLAPQTAADNNYGVCFDCDGTFGTQTVATGIQWGTDATTANNIAFYRSANGTATLELGDGSDLIAASAAAFNINLSDTATYTEWLCHNGTDGATGVQDVGDCNQAGAGDLGEYYGSDGTLEAGDLVVIDPNKSASQEVHDRYGQISKAYVVKNTQSYQPQIIGIISTNPVFYSLSKDVFNADDKPVVVALSGRVPTKVSAENGPIHRGDYLTSSSTPGVAMRATQPGQVVGKALEDFGDVENCQNGNSLEIENCKLKMGKIMAFVNISFADPANVLANMLLDSDGTLILPKVSAKSISLDPNIIVTLNGVKGINSQLYPSAIPQDDNGEAQDETSLDYALLTMVGTLASQKDSITSLRSDILGIAAKTESLKSAEASNSAELAQAKSDLAQVKSLSEEAVSHSQTLGEKIASTSANLASLSQKIDELLASNTPEVNQLELTPPEILLTTDSAKLSATSLNVSNDISTLKLSAGEVTISDSLKALGESSLANTLISGDLVVDGIFSITDGSRVNALPTLYLQTSPLAEKIDIFNGKVTIEKDGTLKVQTLIADQVKVTDKSSGTAIFPAGETELAVFNNLVKPDSIVILTPETLTTQTLAITDKVDGAGFVVKAPLPQTKDIKFSYLIIGKEVSSR
ncbi:MerR family DNA-binding transcriptional regulator [Candidatus Daviesbacteria bacterium]|nr:MerR family DNA-binding transcriptional regulator [Candidatus Daviesbacteria bacterium]